MSIRINKAQATRIANAMMAVNFMPKYEQRRTEIFADIERRWISYIPPEVILFSKQFPKYLEMTRYQDIRNENGMRTVIHSEKSLIRLAGNDDNKWNAKVSNEDFEVFEKYRIELDDLEKQKHSLQTEIVNKLSGRGVKGVCETWPEACEFVKTEMGSLSAQLPAIMNIELNKMLGLPVKK